MTNETKKKILDNQDSPKLALQRSINNHKHLLKNNQLLRIEYLQKSLEDLHERDDRNRE
jgi:hypothetical protein